MLEKLPRVELKPRKPKFSRPTREKIGGKYFVVVRKDGKLWSKREWSPTEFNIEKAVRVFKRNKTLYPNIKAEHITHVFEVVEKNPERRPRGKYQFVVEALLRDGSTLQARSNLTDFLPMEKARQEAYTNLYLRLTTESGVGYRIEEGEQIFAEEVVSVSESVVRYKRYVG